MKPTHLLTLLALLTPTLTQPTKTLDVSVVIPREIKKNALTDLQITTYRGAHCSGQAELFENIKYDGSRHTYMLSFSLSRTLDRSEQLDFSTTGRYGDVVDSKCGVFVGSADTGATAGCHEMNTATCFRLWHH